MKTIKPAALMVLILVAACNRSPEIFVESVFEDKGPTADGLKHVTQVLVPPPGLPEHEQVAKGGPVVVNIRMVVEEKKIEVAPGVFTWAMTFNGTVPGPLIVVHQNDYVQLTLVNPITNTQMHNIDFHAATGQLGGGEYTMVNPGQEVSIRFKATKTGVFVYHCAPGGIMVPIHVVSGMNGAIMVLPRDGLKDENGNLVTYDKAWYIGEQDFYIARDKNGNFKDYKTPADAFPDLIETMRTLIPSHIVYNGSTNALIGRNALKAKVGENVLFITSQANRDTRVHLIGGHADLVYLGGSFNDRPATNYETWPIPAGDAVAALYQFRYPGKYVYLNHNLIEAFLLGAIAEVIVEGEEDENLMRQIEPPVPVR